jgi:hypothetical protein
MFGSLDRVRRGAGACVLALVAVTMSAAPTSATPLTGTTTNDSSAVAGYRQASFQMVPKSIQHLVNGDDRSTGALRIKPGARLELAPLREAGVVCYVGGVAPHRTSPTNNLVIRTDLNVDCTGQVSRITVSLWLLWSGDGVNFTTFANNLNQSASGTPFIVGAQGTQPGACLPQWYMGFADVYVRFLDGTPLEDRGQFITDPVWIGC